MDLPVIKTGLPVKRDNTTGPEHLTTIVHDSAALSIICPSTNAKDSWASSSPGPDSFMVKNIQSDRPIP